MTLWCWLETTSCCYSAGASSLSPRSMLHDCGVSQICGSDFGPVVRRTVIESCVFATHRLSLHFYILVDACHYFVCSVYFTTGQCKLVWLSDDEAVKISLSMWVLRCMVTVCTTVCFVLFFRECKCRSADLVPGCPGTSAGTGLTLVVLVDLPSTCMP